MITKTQRQRNKQRWIRALSEFGITACTKCGYDLCISALDYHHINPGNKKHNSAVLMQLSPTQERVDEIVKDTICLCSRCHRELHAGMWVLENVPVLPKRGQVMREDVEKDPLTPRERQVFGFLMAGKGRKHILQLLGITRNTLEKHISNMRKKSQEKVTIYEGTCVSSRALPIKRQEKQRE